MGIARTNAAPAGARRFGAVSASSENAAQSGDSRQDRAGWLHGRKSFFRQPAGALRQRQPLSTDGTDRKTAGGSDAVRALGKRAIHLELGREDRQGNRQPRGVD